MKKNTFEYPKSAFLGMDKDMSLIMRKLIANQRFLKLVRYNDVDWRNKETVTSQQVSEMFKSRQIWHVPKIKIEKDFKTYIRVTYGSFSPNITNPEYLDNIFEIKIICHFDYWDLGDFELRPYRIAGEIDSMLDNCRLTGIGTLKLVGADPDVYDDEYGGLTLRYLAIRGHEDEIKPLKAFPDEPRLGEF